MVIFCFFVSCRGTNFAELTSLIAACAVEMASRSQTPVAAIHFVNQAQWITNRCFNWLQDVEDAL